MRICPETNQPTPCSEHCRDCAHELYKEVREKAGNAELVTEAFIIKYVGLQGLNMLKIYNFIEHCRVDENGHHWYAL